VLGSGFQPGTAELSVYQDNHPSAASGRLAILVAGTAGAVLFTEIALTRLLSVLLFYHYSFLAISLALFGLAWGGLVAASRPLGPNPQAFASLAWRRLSGAAAALLMVMFILGVMPLAGPDAWRALTIAGLASIPFMMLGEVLARALALGRTRISCLYAIDLLASAGAALLAIPLLKWVQGPAALGVPAFTALVLALIVSSSRQRLWTALGTSIVGMALVVAASSPGPLIELNDPWFGNPVLERWNAYSRVRVRSSSQGELDLVIDRTASSSIPRVPSATAGAPPPIDPAWRQKYPDPTYAIGRSPRRVAVIGVGGGPDLLSALAAGAGEIVGYELNGRIIELLTDDLMSHMAVARRPEVRLVEDEARHALQGSGDRFDVIRASLVDTWASTAAGGFVLSENSLYTVEAWRLFLRRLTPAGVLSITRWHLVSAPAEAERLVALAAEALDGEAFGPAGDRIIALTLPSEVQAPAAQGPVQTITTLVSPTGFNRLEVSRLQEFARRQNGTLLLAPGQIPAPPAQAWSALLSPSTRERYVETSPWAIDPPRDDRPFFFLQLRPLDVFRPQACTYGPITAITLNGVRVLVSSSLFTIAAAGVLLLQLSRLRRTRPGSREPTLTRRGQVYFALLGMAYMAVQLSLHQRLAVILGHPTPTLALVIAAMLVGTGLGSRLSASSLFGRAPNVLLWPCGAVTGLVVLFPLLGGLTSAPSLWWTSAGAGTLCLLVGTALGVALPTGMRLLAPTEGCVAEAWTVNAAFSVAGASLAALGGIILGSHRLIALALPCYAVVLVIGWLETRTSGHRITC
jgi:hypothetical protein